MATLCTRVFTLRLPNGIPIINNQRLFYRQLILTGIHRFYIAGAGCPLKDGRVLIGHISNSVEFVWIYAYLHEGWSKSSTCTTHVTFYL